MDAVAGPFVRRHAREKGVDVFALDARPMRQAAVSNDPLPGNSLLPGVFCPAARQVAGMPITADWAR